MADSLQRLGLNQLNHKLKIRRGGIEIVNGNISGSATSTGSFGQLVIGNGGDILLDEDQRIYFEADKQTWVEANGANLLRIVTNNNQMLLLDHQTGNRAVFGNGTKVYIGANNNALPSNELEVDGTISGSTDLYIGTNTAYVSASSGKIFVTGTITGSSVYGTTIGQNRADGLKTITIEANSIVNQDLTTDAHPTFAGVNLNGDSSVTGSLTITGDLTAQQYIVSSSVTYLTQSFASGSNIFGDSLDDTHVFSGSLDITGSSYISGTLDVQAEGVYSSSTAIYTNNIQNGYPTSNSFVGSALLLSPIKTLVPLPNTALLPVSWSNSNIC